MEKPSMIMTPLVALFLAVILCFCMLSPAEAQTFPKPVGPVNDFANIVPSAYRQKMNALAREVLEKTGTAIVVATFPTIGDNDPRDYTNRLYRAWGIGKKGENKGVLIFLALKERRIRIETGYGVEGILPDGLVGEIIEKDVKPLLKKGEYGQGLLNAVSAVSAVIARDAKVSLDGRSETPREIKPRAAPREGWSIQWASGMTWWLLLIFVFVLFLLFGTRQGRDLLPFILGLLIGGSGRGGGGDSGGFDSFGGGGFGGFGGGDSGGGGGDSDF